jgi:hypothetical protein
LVITTGAPQALELRVAVIVALPLKVPIFVKVLLVELPDGKLAALDGLIDQVTVDPAGALRLYVADVHTSEIPVICAFT